jgi:hypothetical protein
MQHGDSRFDIDSASIRDRDNTVIACKERDAQHRFQLTYVFGDGNTTREQSVRE